MHALRAHHITLVAAITCGALALGGCNLALNLDDYPYQGAVADLSGPDLPVAEDMPEDMPDEDMRPPPVDMNPSVPVPDVIITEIMVNSSGENSVEPGEYIELYNRGTIPALTSRLFIESDASSNNLIFIRAGTLPSAINEGEYYVFVQSDEMSFGIIPHIGTDRYYNWSEGGSGLALTNGGRTISVKYRVDIQDASKDVVLDTITWVGGRLPESIGPTDEERGLAIEEDLAISLAPEHYLADAEERKAPWRWCYDQSASLGMVGLLGSPGKMPLAERCTRSADPLPE